MPTKNPRVNVVLEPLLFQEIKRLAKEDGVSLSLKARDLIREALEIYEDASLASLAEEREKTFDPRKALTHKQVWGKAAR